MSELLTNLKKLLLRFCAIISCHRSLYAALSASHGMGCVITNKPELYGPMAALYVILAFKG